MGENTKNVHVHVHVHGVAQRKSHILNPYMWVKYSKKVTNTAPF